MARARFAHPYEHIISIENLLAAWKEFLSGKRESVDVQHYQRHLIDNIYSLYNELRTGEYRHGSYHAFKISDPKPRDIHKASVQDRLVHHAIYRQLYRFYDHAFIADSYSCRKRKGTHCAMDRFKQFAHKVSKNNTRTCWVLKCDIKKFFASIDQQILMQIVAASITDRRIVALIAEVVHSFQSTEKGKGLPLGNLTSQLLVNVYMNEFDQFLKHKLKIDHYIRYADDFVILSADRELLVRLVPKISDFLVHRLRLTLHPRKISIATFASGVDFLGWVHFSDYRVLRTSTKRRMLKRTVGIEKDSPTLQSYLGLLAHGNARKLATKISTLAEE